MIFLSNSMLGSANSYAWGTGNGRPGLKRGVAQDRFLATDIYNLYLMEKQRKYEETPHTKYMY